MKGMITMSLLIGQAIRKQRDNKQLSLREFAKACGLSHSYIDSLEKGFDRRNGKPVSPTIDTLEKIATGLGLSLGELLTNAGIIQERGLTSMDNQLSDFWEMLIAWCQKNNIDSKESDKILAPLHAIMNDRIPVYDWEEFALFTTDPYCCPWRVDNRFTPYADEFCSSEKVNCQGCARCQPPATYLPPGA
jgi:transcriptional regulator with XRE-family HTH domain